MESLQTFVTWFWISLVASIATGVCWYIIVRRREAWLRWTNAEAAFWQRLKLPVSTIESMKQMEQSKGFAYLVGGVCILFILLLLGNGWAYIYFRAKQREFGPPNQGVPANRRHAGQFSSFGFHHRTCVGGWSPSAVVAEFGRSIQSNRATKELPARLTGPAPG